MCAYFYFECRLFYLSLPIGIISKYLLLLIGQYLYIDRSNSFVHAYTILSSYVRINQNNNKHIITSIIVLCAYYLLVYYIPRT